MTAFKRPIRSISMMLLALTFTCSCSGQNKLTHLRDTVRSFHQQIRWERWNSASVYVDKDQRESWYESRRDLKSRLKVHDMQVTRSVSAGPQATTAQLSIRVDWYRLRDMTLHTTNWVQEWEHGQDGWKLKSEKRARGETGKGLAWP